MPGRARPVLVEVGVVDRDQRTEHGRDGGDRPQRGDPRVETGPAIIPGPEQRRDQHDQAERTGAGEAPVADVSRHVDVDHGRRRGRALNRRLGESEGEDRPAGQPGAGPAGQSGSPPESSTPRQPPEDHRDDQQDAGDREVGPEVVELPRSDLERRPGLLRLDLDDAHEHPDDRRDGWDDREDQQWSDPERAAVLDGFLVRPLPFPRRVRLGQHSGGAAVRRGMLARRVPVLPVRRLVDVLLSRRLVGLTVIASAGRAELRLSGPRGCELAGLPIPVTGPLGVRCRGANG